MKENSSQKERTCCEFDLTAELIHGMEVSNLAYDLARELGYEKEICYELAKAGVLHDIGKIVAGELRRITGYALVDRGDALCADPFHAGL